MSKIYAVVVNWNNYQITLRLIEALISQSIPLEIIVVDNCSSDNSVAVLESESNDKFFLIKRSTNGGFGQGCNDGIIFALTKSAKYIWLINNDAVPDINCAYELLRIASSDNTIGIVGGCIIDPENFILPHCGSVVSPFSLQSRYIFDQYSLQNYRYSFVTGACMFINCAIFSNKNSLFDPMYFMYWEDLDFCMRVKRHGYKLCVAPAALLTHSAGTSSKDLQLSRHDWQINSSLRWVNKHYPIRYYGFFIIFLKNIIKSIFDGDLNRLLLTLKIFSRLHFLKWR
ncbi:glycosyltransferase family 2 protein [Polynucleobacter sp. HIN7]|uniref:glycosyltransferase family 2 protein n=1 Tax=Polynucleobacter sp. HIN7 TaxID=3047866 RepID=UPI002572FCC5|nr:glycosyltransferase family 2 protein [Polynucleobacter sp. HIN7]